MLIAAVVVTRNRETLLKECIEAIRSQTRKVDEIIVVDNDSSDGTRQWLALQNDLTVILQGNLGGAGGFNTGIKIAYEHGHTWLWCMDDDGRPALDALQKLCDAIARRPLERVFNSFPINKDDHSKTAFAFDWWERGRKYRDVDQVIADASIKELDGLPAFFLGTLLHRDVVAAIGLPMTKLFIRGDEHDYIHRIYKHGWRIYTVLDSRFYHPDPPIKRLHFLWRGLNYEPMDDWKRYYCVRNAIFLGRVHGEYPERVRGKKPSPFWLRVVRFVLTNGIVQWSIHSSKKKKIASLAMITRATVHGLMMRSEIDSVSS